jgi:hypothetical protein
MDLKKAFELWDVPRSCSSNLARTAAKADNRRLQNPLIK